MLVIKALNVGFKVKKTVIPLYDGLSFALEKGELLFLTGRNGSGKTTLLRTISGFHNKLAGRVMIDGTDFEKLTSSELAKKMAWVSTDKPRLDYLKVYDLVALGRFPYQGILGQLTNNDKELIDYAVKECKIEPLLERTFSDLSDGEKQKTLIARAIAQDTDYLLMDEPTAHLDIINRIEVFKLLKDLSLKTGKGILVASHELEIALKLADKILLLGRNGRFWFDEPLPLAESGVIESEFTKGVINFDSANLRFDVNLK